MRHMSGRVRLLLLGFGLNFMMRGTIRLLPSGAHRGHVSGRFLRHVQREFAAAPAAWTAVPKVTNGCYTRPESALFLDLFPAVVTFVVSPLETPLSFGSVRDVGRYATEQRSERFSNVKTTHPVPRVWSRRLPPARAQRLRPLSSHAHAGAAHGNASTKVLLLFTNNCFASPPTSNLAIHMYVTLRILP